MTTGHAAGTSRLVARATNCPDQTDWTDEPADRTARQHTRAHSPDEQSHLFCQGEGREFESRRPLQEVAGQPRSRLGLSSFGRPITPIELLIIGRPLWIEWVCRDRCVSAARVLGSYGSTPAGTPTRIVAGIAPQPCTATEPTAKEPSTNSSPRSAPTTIRQTRSVLDRYLHPHLGSLRVGEVTPAVIDACYARLRRGGGTRGQPLSPGTLARIHVVLRSAFAQAVRWGWVWDNPAERAHRIVATPRELEPPSPAELSELFAAIVGRDQQLHMFVVLAAVTGARRAQLLGLRWHNVDLAHGRVAFCAGWVEGPNGPVLADTKTKRRHMVDLDVATVALLCTHHDSVGDAAVPDHFVFSDDDGVTAWKPNRVTKAFVRHRRAAGLRPFRLHDLRHFMATEMLQAGIPLATVARRLDHRRVSTTLDRYAHAVPGGDATAATALRAIIDHAR